MNDYTSGSDIESEEDDYAPITVSSWGDQAKKEEPPKAENEEKEQDEKKHDWSSLLDPNAEVAANGVGSGGLHRLGKNYRPVDETLILQQRLSGASLKTEEEKKEHRGKNAKIKRKIKRYAKELEEDRPTPRKLLSTPSSFTTSRYSRKPHDSAQSTSFSSSKTRPFSSTKKTFTKQNNASFTKSLSSSSSTTTKTDDSQITTLPMDKPLAVFRETAPWDDIPEDTHPSISSGPSISLPSPQGSKKRPSVRFSQPLEQPPPTILHSPKLKRISLSPVATTSTPLSSGPDLTAQPSQSQRSSTTTTNATTASTMASPVRKEPVRQPPLSSASNNPWLNTPLLDEPFWDKKETTTLAKEQEQAKKEGDMKLVEEIEPPHTLQNLNKGAAPKWTSGNMLTPLPVTTPTTPTKRMDPPPWEPPLSAEWFKTFEPPKPKKMEEVKVPESYKDDWDLNNGSDWQATSVRRASQLPLSSSPKGGKGWQSSSTPTTSTKDTSVRALSPVSSSVQKTAALPLVASTATTSAISSDTERVSSTTTSSKDTRQEFFRTSPKLVASFSTTTTTPPVSSPTTILSNDSSWGSSMSSTVDKKLTVSTASSTISSTESDITGQTSPTPPADNDLTSSNKPPVLTHTPPASESSWQSSPKSQTSSNNSNSSSSYSSTASMWTDTATKSWEALSNSQKDATSSTWKDSASTMWNDASSSSWKDSAAITWGDSATNWDTPSATSNNNNNYDTSSSTSWDNDATRTWGSTTDQGQNAAKKQQSTRSGSTGRFSRPDRPKYSTRQKGPRPANYRPDQPLVPPTKVAPPSRMDNPVVVSINVELGANKKIPVHIHQYDDPQNLARHFAKEHAIQSPDIIAALNQLFATQKTQAMKRRIRPHVHIPPVSPPAPPPSSTYSSYRNYDSSY